MQSNTTYQKPGEYEETLKVSDRGMKKKSVTLGGRRKIKKKNLKDLQSQALQKYIKKAQTN